MRVFSTFAEQLSKREPDVFPFFNDFTYGRSQNKKSN